MQRSCADVNSTYKRKFWTNSGGPLVKLLKIQTEYLKRRTATENSLGRNPSAPLRHIGIWGVTNEAALKKSIE